MRRQNVGLDPRGPPLHAVTDRDDDAPLPLRCHRGHRLFSCTLIDTMRALTIVPLLSLAAMSLVQCSSNGDAESLFSTVGASGQAGTSGSGDTTFSAGTGGATAGGTSVGGSSGTAVTGANGTATSGTGSSGAGGCAPALCEGKLYLCANCIDDDADGKLDAEDPDCLGPCDNTEDRLELGIPGAGNAPCKRDCYFDKDSGAGNDDCAYDLRCDPLSPEPIDCKYANPPPPNAGCDAKPSSTCLQVCKNLTPNGCDCFGCCELPGGSGNFVYIGTTDASDVPTCTIAGAKDPSKCAKCTPMLECFDSCDKCELCLGKDTLPPECQPEDQCPGGTACGLPGQPPCPAGEYCLTGCCTVPSPT